MKHKIGTIFLLLLTALVCLGISSCSSIKKIVDDKIASVSKDKYMFNINKKNATQIYSGKNSYQILDINIKKLL